MNSISKLGCVMACCAVGIASAASNPDQTFVTKAAQGGAAEVKLGQLAASKGKNQKVKDFGQKMVDDHSKAGDELKGIAQKNGATVPGDITAKDNSLVNRLSGLSGDDFDKAYMSAMVKDHETDIAEFQREADKGGDADIKAFASKTLPTLRDHLQMAKDAASAVGAKQ
jgi:putative membrane protein